jgi:hypothetical protein
MELPPQVGELINELINKTAKGSIKWERTADASEFLCVLGGEATFRIDNLLGTDLVYEFVMTDSAGKEVISVSSTHNQALAKPLATLYNTVRDRTLNITGQIDIVLKKLREK